MECMGMNFHGLQRLQLLKATGPGSSCNASFLRAIGFDLPEKVATVDKIY